MNNIAGDCDKVGLYRPDFFDKSYILMPEAFAVQVGKVNDFQFGRTVCFFAVSGNFYTAVVEPNEKHAERGKRYHADSDIKINHLTSATILKIGLPLSLKSFSCSVSISPATG